MRLTLTCVLLLLSRIAMADDASQARAHYNQAQGHFAVGEFKLAADGYQAAYKLKQDPALLFNAAQARRLAGENTQALILYKNYLQFHPKARNISEVKEQITKLEEAIAAAESAKTSPPINTVEPDRTEPKETTAPPQQQVVVTPPSEKPVDKPVPIYKKWWLWTAVGVVVVAAVVIPVAVVASKPADWSNVSNISNAVVEVRW